MVTTESCSRLWTLLSGHSMGPKTHTAAGGLAKPLSLRLAAAGWLVWTGLSIAAPGGLYGTGLSICDFLKACSPSLAHPLAEPYKISAGKADLWFAESHLVRPIGKKGYEFGTEGKNLGFGTKEFNLSQQTSKK